MAEFLVSGYYGDNNTGDEAILAGMIRSIRAIHPEAAFTVISKKAAQTRSLHGVAAVSRNDFKGTLQAISRADVVLSGGGSLLQDVTSTKSLLYYLGIIGAAKLRMKPAMVYAQGIGPVTRAAGRSLVRLVLNRVDLITVRDPESVRTLHDLGVRRPPVAVTADSALALGPSDPARGEALLAEMGLDTGRPVIGVSVRPWRKSPAWERELARALDLLSRETGAQVLFVPMQQPHDVKAAAGVAGFMQQNAHLAQGAYTHEHIQAIVSRCDLIIGERFHFLVFAAMNGVPLVGLSYDPKNDGFLRALGERAVGTAQRLEAYAVAEAGRRALATRESFRERLFHKMSELTPLSRRNAELAVELALQRGRAH